MGVDEPDVIQTIGRPVYRATCTFRGGWWAVEVPELSGVVTHTTNPARADASIREAIAFQLDADPTAFDLQVVIVERPDGRTRDAVAS